jgi:tetratricopeptide (TPR) repeat protein
MGEAAIPNWEEAQRLFEQSLSLWRSLDDHVNEAWNLLFLGDVYGAGGDLGGAKQLYEESLAIHRALRNHVGIGMLLRNLGLVAAQLGDRAEVQRLVGESLTLFQAQDRQLYAGFLLAELGLVQRECGDYEAARQRFEESLTASRFLGSASTESFALLLLGCMAMDGYDCNEAEQKFSEAMTLSQAHGYQAGIASSLASLGHLAIFQGHFKAAADYVRQSVALNREIGDTRAVAYALADLGAAFGFLGEFAEADATIKAALTTAEEMELDRVWIVITQRQAQGDVYAGWYRRARVQAGATLNLARKGGYKTLYGMQAGWPDGFRVFHRTNVTGRTHGVLGWAALAEEQYAQAKQAFQDSLSAFQALRNREDEAWSLAGLGRAAHGLGKQAQAQEYLLEALEIVVEIRAFIPLVHLMPTIPVLLADADAQSQKERAVELYALARTQPLVAKSPLFEDVAGKHIAAATADLPPDVAAAAQERGRVLDWWETADRLLEELRQMGWGTVPDP